MPRPSKGTRLYRRTDTGIHYIIDGSRQISTRTRERGQAETALAAYIAERDRPRGGPRDPETMKVEEVLDIYATEYAPTLAAPAAAGYAIDALLDFWGELPVAAVTGNTCRRYATARNRAPGTVRRDLGVLQAAINYSHREGYLTRPMKVTMPAQSSPRDRWLTRSEAARLLWAARRTHLAPFILVALYTGTRAGAILRLRFRPHTSGGWIDVERGVMHRAGAGERQTKKRRPPVRLPAKLLAHARRWDREWVVQWKGSRVGSIKTAWHRVVRDAGLPGVTPHVLKHTAITWAMHKGVPIADAAGFFGTSMQTLERVYLHHHPDWQKATAAAMDGR